MDISTKIYSKNTLFSGGSSWAFSCSLINPTILTVTLFNLLSLYYCILCDDEYGWRPGFQKYLLLGQRLYKLFGIFILYLYFYFLHYIFIGLYTLILECQVNNILTFLFSKIFIFMHILLSYNFISRHAVVPRIYYLLSCNWSFNYLYIFIFCWSLYFNKKE